MHYVHAPRACEVLTKRSNWFVVSLAVPTLLRRGVSSTARSGRRFFLRQPARAHSWIMAFWTTTTNDRHGQKGVRGTGREGHMMMCNRKISPSTTYTVRLGYGSNQGERGKNARQPQPQAQAKHNHNYGQKKKKK